MERLQKVIANSGYSSRRKAEELILAGKVKVNGLLITELGYKVKETDDIQIENTHLKKESKEYYLLYKPEKTITSVRDEVGRTTVVDLIPTSKRIYPVGRLDYDTTGIILLTNDGELANILMHPSFLVEKTYIAKVEGTLTGKEFDHLKNGIIIEGRKVIPQRVKLRLKNKAKNFSKIEITIIEGRNHIVKKVFQAINHPVLQLKRESYAFLNLEGLKKGSYRKLTIKEVKKLYSLK
ncbi:MAG: rRNA pseudouridine synthase [Bacilli bacterium]|nr:rRNA pseudouridine synthase [Bacilli bacterium]